jgi:VWFA-related protein
MQIHGLRLAVAVGLALSVAPLGAQTPAPAPSASAAQGSQPTFRVNIDLVTMDAIVRNNQEQFVADLTKDDFEILEDGVAQQVTSFTLVHGGRVHNLLEPPPPPAQEGVILPPSRPRNDTTGRIFLLIVDDLHLDFRNTGRIRSLFQKMSKSLIHEGDMFCIVSTGPRRLPSIRPTTARCWTRPSRRSPAAG